MRPEPERGPQESAAAEAAAPPAPVNAGRDRTLWAILAGIAVLVVAALAIVFSRGAPAQLAESTPAGVVQRYAAALIAGDERKAASYLSAAASNRCTGADRALTRNLRITLIATTERQDTADVEVLVTVAEAGGPFGSSEYQVAEVFDLVREGGLWVIDRTPWQLSVCGGPAVGP